MFHDVDLILGKSFRIWVQLKEEPNIRLCNGCTHIWNFIIEDDRCIYACQSENPRHYSGTRLIFIITYDSWTLQSYHLLILSPLRIRYLLHGRRWVIFLYIWLQNKPVSLKISGNRQVQISVTLLEDFWWNNPNE